MKLAEIASLFGVSDVSEISELKGGHINRTYLVTAASGRYVLQSLNREVFAYPETVMRNISAVGEAFSRLENSPVTVPRYLLARGTNFLEVGGEIWRMYGYAAAEKTEKSGEYLTGLSFGTFIKVVNGENVRLGTAIDGFHSFSRYFEKLSRIAPEKAELFKGIRERLDGIFTEKLPMRNVHNDAKADNVIIGRQCTVIDLDTAMPGYAALDYGDMIRSVCKGTAPDMTAVGEITRGFAEGLDGLLTGEEIASLYYGILCAAGELSMRYYIDGVGRNGYFKGKTPGECIYRGDELYAQLCMFTDYEAEICRIIAEAFFQK